jgi:hypothetical protein
MAERTKARKLVFIVDDVRECRVTSLVPYALYRPDVE